MNKPHVVIKSESVIGRQSMSNYQGALISLTPDQYLKLAHSEFTKPPYKSSMSRYRDFYRENSPARTIYHKELTESYKKGIPLEDIPRLSVSGVKTRIVNNKYEPVIPKKGLIITGHEGRNRAIIAEEQGIKHIPVLIEVEGLKNWNSYGKIYEPKRKKLLKQRILISNKEILI